MDYDKQRIGMYRKIEIARKQLPSFGEADFRGLLQRKFGVTSRKSLTLNQLSRLIDTLAEMGASFTVNGKEKKVRPRPASRPDWIEITDSMPYAREKRQILAIWRKLGYSMTSLDTRVKRAFGTPCFIWLHDYDQIKTLMLDLRRREKAFDKKQAVEQGEQDATAR